MKYDIKEIHYRNLYGELLWKGPMVFSNLYAVNDNFIYNYKSYIVKRVAVADTVQHVNVVEI